MKNFLLITFSITLSWAQAQTKDYTFNLQQAIDFALQNQVKVQNAIIDEQIAADKVKEVRGIGLPQVNGSFDVKDFIEIPTQIIPASAFNPYAPKDALAALKFGVNYNASLGIDASQLVFDASYFMGLQASQVYLDLIRKNTQRTKIEVATSVMKSYYMMLVNDERVKLLDANIARLKKLMDDTKALNENGFVEKIDLDRITVTYNNILVEKDKLTRLLALSAALMKFQIGMDQGANLILSDKLEDIKFDMGNVSADKFDYAKRIEYSLVQSQLISSKLQLKRDKFSSMPNMVAYGAVSANAMRLNFDMFKPSTPWYPTAIVGAKIGIPIFGGGIRYYRVQQSKLSVVKAENDMKSLQQGIDLERSNTTAMLQNASSSLETQKKNITLAEDVYKTTKLKYDQGVGSNLEVLTAETALKEAQTNYFNALYDALVAKVDFDKANGLIK